MRKTFPSGVWPVMLTPFTQSNEVDFESLHALVDWYINNGADGLFAVCQSSEMFWLTLDERCKIAAAVVKFSDGRVPVICSGHVSDTPNDQAYELNELAKTGVDALVLLTNRFAAQEEPDTCWQKRCEELLHRLPVDIPLGLYECPYPYKRVLTPDLLRWCAETGRFYFLKDTCCDSALIRRKIEATASTQLKLYNANTATLLQSLRDGAAGYSGVMANFHPELYVWLCRNIHDKRSDTLSEWLTMASLIELQLYPVNAKYHLQTFRQLPITTVSRAQDDRLMTETFREHVRVMEHMALREAELQKVREHI